MTFGEFMKKCKARYLMIVELNDKFVDARKIDFCAPNDELIGDYRYIKDHTDNNVKWIDYNEFAKMLEVTIES